MNWSISFVLFLLLNGILVHGLKCFTCYSTTSMDDCSSKQIKSTCPAELSDGYCGKLEVKDESGVTQSFSKGCFPEDVCTGDVVPCNQPGNYCKGACCFSDFCNGEGGVVERISCNYCTSTTSLEDCSKQQKSQQCPVGWNRCGILETQSENGKSYLKGCFASQTCQTFCAGGTNDVLGIKCELSCCEKRFCN
ncbi:uncharacterized protein [Montipora foliosa]|uniref:uncharacterized protein isoform X1 n=1 Tax=Montipora foliosa TaxID=591990 RepID=UPI0035F17493